MDLAQNGGAGEAGGASTSVAEASRTVSQQSGIDARNPLTAATRHVARLGRDYRHGDNLFRATRSRPYKRMSDDPLYRPLRIYTTDPVRSAYEGAVAIASVPYEPLEPGPVGHRIAVIDDHLDAERGAGNLVDLEQSRILLMQGLPASPGNEPFHHQMVYAVCCSVLASFKVALGRDPSWGFVPRGDGEPDRLVVRPRFAEERNAFYDKRSGEIRFGWFKADEKPGPGSLPRGRIYTCLSHDVIAHEMAHALLDGMRSHFADPTNQDVLAFHEAFADIVAVLQHFTHQDSVRRAIARSMGVLGRDRTIFSLAEQFGAAAGYDGPLRIALDRGQDVLTYTDASHEPHELGSVLVGAVLEAMATIFERRVARLKIIYELGAHSGRELHPDYRDLLAEEASKVAGHLLFLCIRAVDYCPPVSITFGEYLRALVTADRDLVEDDRWNYREALIAAFGRREIFPTDVHDLSEPSLLWRRPERTLPDIPSLDLTHLGLGSDPGQGASEDEIERQAAALADLVTDPEYMGEFGLSSGSEVPVIESIRTICRVGPDRQVRFGLVAEVLQRGRERVGEREVEMLGGSTVIMGGGGDVRYVIRKAVDRADRAKLQAEFHSTSSGRRQIAAADCGETWRTVHEGHRGRAHSGGRTDADRRRV